MRLIRQLLLLFALFNLGLSSLPTSAAVPAERSRVNASLVAADSAVQPGREVLVALRLVHDREWHTYWVTPGTGLPTTIEWSLPPGWKAGEIQWPTPKVIRDHTGMIVGQGYDGDLLLPVVLTPPANLATGSPVKLQAKADWLMCAETCIPGSAELTLELPVVGSGAQPDPAWNGKIRATLAALPRADPKWTLSASRDQKTVTLTAKPAGAVAHQPQEPWFFSENGVIGYDLPQKLTKNADGGFTLALAVATDAPSDAKRLVGVLAAKNGWAADGSLPGLKVDVPFESASRLSLATLFLALLGGLILNLMPCVFPVLGIKILGFVNQAGHERSRVIAHGLAFTIGVLLSFWALAGVLAFLRAGGAELGWGFQLQSPAFVYGLAVVMLIFAMNLSGVFEFGLRATAVGSGLQAKSGYTGSFFSGVLATVVATPCSAPFLAPALGAALAVTPAQSFLIFTAIAIGLALPYLLLSAFPQAVKMLPRPGGWMETFKQFMAFPLYATTAYLGWVLAAQTSEEGFLSALISLVVVALAIWLYGRWTAPGTSTRRARFGVAGLLVVGALGLWVGWPSSVPTEGSGGIEWKPWSRDTVEKLRSQGKIVYVDFTARWCATCQANKRIVFHDEDVLKYFAEHRIETLRADWTKRDPKITAELAAYGRSAVPFNVIWVPGRNDPIILPELLTGSIVLDALKGAVVQQPPSAAPGT